MNALGYAFVAALWRDSIQSGGVTFPMDPCPAPTGIYIVEGLDAAGNGQKQTLLESGDEYYNDAPHVLTNVPSELEDGVWITQDNADNANTDIGYTTFDVGASAVTVYIAYDPAGDPPTSGSHTFTAATLSGNLTTSDPDNGTFSVVSATGVTGAVSIDGNASGADPDPQQGHLIIVVP